VAQLMAVHRRLPNGQATHKCRPERWGAAWHDVVRSEGRGQTTSRSAPRVVHDVDARRGTASDGRRLDGPREDVHGKHPWTSVHLPDMVPGAESKRGGWMTERRSSLARTMTPELNDGEGAGPSGWGAAMGPGGALGPAYGERGGVRWLGTDEVVENRGERDGDGLAEADTTLVRTGCKGWPPFIAMHYVKVTRATP
jgi:hypothetical protein